MNLNEALLLITKVTGNLNGTRKDHELIQQAIQVITKATEKKEEKTE